MLGKGLFGKVDIWEKYLLVSSSNVQNTVFYKKKHHKCY